jgi:hypothetical protein
MITSILPKQDISFKGAKFHLKPLELAALRREKAEQETLFRQGNIGDCWAIAAIKSTMFALNEYANKVGKPCYNARNWIRKLVTLNEAGGARICFPLAQNIHNKFNVPAYYFDIYKDYLLKGNKRVQFLETAYSMLLRVIDKGKIEARLASESLTGGYPFLAMRDITGLKSFALKDTGEQKELFKTHTGKLFRAFKEHPENLIVTLSTKDKITPYATAAHAFSLKKVVDDGLIIVNPHSKTNEEIKISFDNFYKYFNWVDFARIQHEKMFNMLEKAKQTTMEVLDSRVFRLKKDIQIQVRDSDTSTMKNYVYYDVEDKIRSKFIL